MVRDILTMDDIDLSGRTVLLRVDINSPINPITGDILDTSRFRLHVPTIKDLSDSKLVILAHQSRPGKGDFTSLEEHSHILEKLLGVNVDFIDELISRRALQRISAMNKGEIVMLENTRLYSEDIALNKDMDLMRRSLLVTRLASVADVFVNDAFAASHRAQPSLIGFSEYMPMLAGRLMEHEINALSKITEGNVHPSVGILGGAKIDDSIAIALKLAKAGKVDKILTTGVVANGLLHCSGYDIGEGNLALVKNGTSDWDATEKAGFELMENYSDIVKVPKDVALLIDEKRVDMDVSKLATPREPIYDIGIRTIEYYSEFIKNAQYIFMNGPAGYFENEAFSIGTVQLFNMVAASTAYSIVGGGHTGAVVEKLNIGDKMGHVSSGGGAFISFLSGKQMPVINALKMSKQRYSEGYYNIIRR